MVVLIIISVLSLIGIVCSLVVFFMAYSDYKRCDRMLKRMEEYERSRKNVS